MITETVSEVHEEVKVPGLIELADDSIIQGTTEDSFLIKMSDGKVHMVEGKELKFLSYAVHHGSTMHFYTKDGLSVVMHENGNVTNHKCSGNMTQLDISFCKQTLIFQKKKPTRHKLKLPSRISAQGVRQSNARF